MNIENFPGLIMVVVNWNKPQETIECIESALQGGMSVSKIILVDNGSQDDSVSKIRKSCPGVQLFCLLNNLGFAGGYNYGIQKAIEAGAEQILLLNNDTTVDENTILSLQTSAWDVAVPKIYYHDDPTRIWSTGASWRRFPPMVVIRGYRKPDSKQYDQPVELEYATACGLLVRRRVFETIGLFDNQFENYYEDYDFCYRLREAGFHLGYVPHAHVWHKVSTSLGLKSPKFWRYLGRNSVLFYRKNKRFSFGSLICFLFWVTIREMITLHFEFIPDFWAGVDEGLKLVKHGNSSL